MNDSNPPSRRSFGEWFATKLAGAESAPAGPVREVDGDVLEVTAGRTVVSFWAPWCGPCRMMRPLIDELAAEHIGHAEHTDDDEHTGHDQHTVAAEHTGHNDDRANLEFVRVNVDTNPGIASRFRVMSVPTLVVVDADGVEHARLPGLVPKRDPDAFVGRLG